MKFKLNVKKLLLQLAPYSTADFLIVIYHPNLIIIEHIRT